MTSRCFRARGVWSVWAGPGVPGAPHVSPGLLQQAAHRQAGLGLLLTGKDTVQELMVLSENCPYHSVFLRNILSFTSKIIFFLKQWNYQYRMILYIYLSDNYLITTNTCSSSSLASQCVSFVAPPAGQRGVRSHQEVQVF